MTESIEHYPRTQRTFLLALTLAISLLFGFLAPDHEQRLAAALRDALQGEVPVSVLAVHPVSPVTPVRGGSSSAMRGARWRRSCVASAVPWVTRSMWRPPVFSGSPL